MFKAELGDESCVTAASLGQSCGARPGALPGLILGLPLFRAQVEEAEQQRGCVSVPLCGKTRPQMLQWHSGHSLSLLLFWGRKRRVQTHLWGRDRTGTPGREISPAVLTSRGLFFMR